jgi:hypothetical protein
MGGGRGGFAGGIGGGVSVTTQSFSGPGGRQVTRFCILFVFVGADVSPDVDM